MNNIVYKCLLIPSGAVLSGCVGLCDSSIVRIGPGTYAADPINGNGCGAKYEVKAAQDYCAKSGFDFQVIQLGQTSGDIYKSRSNTTFRCLK